MPLVGDFSAAEDLVQDAVEAALTHWPVEGIPERPDAWLYTMARRRGLDTLRRAGLYRAKLALVPLPSAPEPDDRLRLIFTCCHPALPRAAQVALTLRADDRADRAGLPGAGDHGRAADHPGQAQDQRGGDSLPGAVAGRARRASGRDPGGDLSALQRGVRRVGPPSRRRRVPGVAAARAGAGGA
ncbi:sigma factor [Actinoplanes sp. NPDC051411]|uniref:sigma factor n=1 Tax=Actinoplanes sp. NPDC051411 TaxID=3155522 RepID=UPI00343EDEB8